MFVKSGIVTLLIAVSLVRSKPSSCKDSPDDTILQLENGIKFSCPYIRNNPDLCKNEVVETKCCKSCISSDVGCNDSKDKVFNLNGWKYRCCDLLRNPLFQSTQCESVNTARLCCKSCNSKASGECKDLTKKKFYRFFKRDYGCDDILRSTFKNFWCATKKVRGICCQSCRAQN